MNSSYPDGNVAGCSLLAMVSIFILVAAVLLAGS